MIPVETCGLSESTQEAITQLLASDPRIVSAKLFGSRAKGNFKRGSDIDLALDAPRWQLSNLLAFQMKLDDLLLPYKIDIVILHLVDDDALLGHIHRMGIDLYR
jgi:predicted nucleotidyltransferase